MARAASKYIHIIHIYIYIYVYTHTHIHTYIPSGGIVLPAALDKGSEGWRAIRTDVWPFASTYCVHYVESDERKG
jgi:hypothetical protein